MPFSLHSHSGEFCGDHARDKLEEVVEEAIRQKFNTFALTEHMPRLHLEDLYPGEVVSTSTIENLLDTFERFRAEARRLQIKYADKITLLVGFECDWIRASSQQDIENLIGPGQWDLFVGSVHHVHGVPIDFSAALYARALSISAANAREAGIPAEPEEMLFADYYDTQLDMLQALRPPIVGHFDLIRLMSRRPNDSMRQYSRVWRKVLRNLQYIYEYGGVLEVNSAAMRKGLDEPYPARDILERVIEMNGKITLSDDSHGTGQIGWGYPQMLEYLRSCKARSVTRFIPCAVTIDERFPGVMQIEVGMPDLARYPFWSALNM